MGLLLIIFFLLKLGDSLDGEDVNSAFFSGTKERHIFLHGFRKPTTLFNMEEYRANEDIYTIKIIDTESYICQENLPETHSLPMITCNSDARTKLLAFLVYGKFLKKVWTRRKEISRCFETLLDSSNGQAIKLKTQVKTLKSLLTSDEQVISSCFREVQTLKGVLTDLETKHKIVLEGNNELEMRSQKLREDLLRTEAEAHNNKNSLVLVRSEIDSLEGQLQKEKEKSFKFKKENKSLLGKIENLTNNLKEKCVALENADKKISCLQDQLRIKNLLIEESLVKVEGSERALESAEKQLEIVHTRLKEEKYAYEIMIQEAITKSMNLESQVASLKTPPLKTKIIMITEWLISIPLSLSSW
ncbi:tropomyosin alpha-4 chain isoform X2 [Halyomorpha halys]|uniref:tropomyosin alpha-4 chain isoform X2 n=1 Tax=Halyomorpha halys TaxID=286706 RepID=UPI0034D2B3DB